MIAAMIGIPRPPWPSGFDVRSDRKQPQSAISTLQTHGAIHIEKAEGVWRDGQWIDFDPLAPPVIVDGPNTNSSSQQF